MNFFVSFMIKILTKIIQKQLLVLSFAKKPKTTNNNNKKQQQREMDKEEEEEEEEEEEMERRRRQRHSIDTSDDDNNNDQHHVQQEEEAENAVAAAGSADWKPETLVLKLELRNMELAAKAKLNKMAIKIYKKMGKMNDGISALRESVTALEKQMAAKMANPNGDDGTNSDRRTAALNDHIQHAVKQHCAPLEARIDALCAENAALRKELAKARATDREQQLKDADAEQQNCLCGSIAPQGGGNQFYE